MDKRRDTNIHAGNKIYRDQLVTLGDLQELKDDLILSLSAMIQANASQPVKKWLKSYEVVKCIFLRIVTTHSRDVDHLFSAC